MSGPIGRRGFLKAGIAAIGAMALRAGAQSSGLRRPNIVLILADDLHLSDCTPRITPNVHSIGDAGIEFRAAYACSPFCLPSRAGMITGRYPQGFGCETNRDGGLPATVVTMAEMLRDAGYRTGMVGKWHLGSRPEQHPQERGFDQFYGCLGAQRWYVRQREPIWHGKEKRVRNIPYLTDWFVDRAINFIRESSSSEKSFFLYLPFTAPHVPLIPPRRHLRKFADLASPRREYLGLVSSLDEAVGKVMAELRSQRIVEDTLVVFSSDNGGVASFAGESKQLRGGKGLLYEGGIRVPLMMQWLGRLPAGTVVEEPVMLIDLPPTFCRVAAAGGPLPRFDGVDVLSDLDPDRPLFWRMNHDNTRTWAVRRGDWKLVYRHAVEWADYYSDQRVERETKELFNLDSDVDEQHDLATQRPDIARELEPLYRNWEGGLAQTS